MTCTQDGISKCGKKLETGCLLTAVRGAGTGRVAPVLGRLGSSSEADTTEERMGMS